MAADTRRNGDGTMRLSLFINPTGHHQAAWLHPDADPDAGINFGHYRAVVQAAERACFDAIFLADQQAIRAGPPEAVSRTAQYIANFEPLTLLSALAAVTERIGLIATASTSYNYPFQVARKFASLDYISGGRAGWNMVASWLDGEAPNFGLDAHYDYATRYARAGEFVEACLGLWDSWEDDAFPRDRETGIFTDLGKQHVLDHEGEFLRVRGPLNIPRMPQGYPVLVQAGSSDTGKAFAAKYTEMMFVTPLDLASARELYREMKERVAALGRNPDHFLIMPGLVVFVGRTTAEAQERFEELQSLLHPTVALSTLATKLGNADLSGCALDEPLPASAAPPGEKSHFERWFALSEREGLTLRQLALRASASMAGAPPFIGSVTEIADLMEEWFRTGAADGFNLQPPHLPGGLAPITELVVPELQRRGLVRTAYAGSTLREHFGLPRPAWGERTCAVPG
jgi:alkanesulfonate monooxygenase